MESEWEKTKQGCCSLSWLQKCVSKMRGKTNTREDCEIVPIKMTFGDPERLTPDFGENNIFLMEGAVEDRGGGEEGEDEEDMSEEEILVKPLSRQISPLPSLQSSGPSSASRSLLHMCLQCNQPSTSLQPLVTCRACSLAEYCSVECQALHRPFHRDTCSQIVRLLRRLYQVLSLNWKLSPKILLTGSTGQEATTQDLFGRRRFSAV